MNRSYKRCPRIKWNPSFPNKIISTEEWYFNRTSSILSICKLSMFNFTNWKSCVIMRKKKKVGVKL